MSSDFLKSPLWTDAPVLEVEEGVTYGVKPSRGTLKLDARILDLGSIHLVISHEVYMLTGNSLQALNLWISHERGGERSTRWMAGVHAKSSYPITAEQVGLEGLRGLVRVLEEAQHTPELRTHESRKVLRQLWTLLWGDL